MKMNVNLMKIFIGCCSQCTNNSNLKTNTFFMPIYGALENSTLQKHYNMTCFLQNIFFNVKIINRHRSLKCQI